MISFKLKLYLGVLLRSMRPNIIYFTVTERIVIISTAVILNNVAGKNKNVLTTYLLWPVSKDGRHDFITLNKNPSKNDSFPSIYFVVSVSNASVFYMIFLVRSFSYSLRIAFGTLSATTSPMEY